MISLALSLALASSGSCNSLQKSNLELEARVGIEPTNAAFAEPCLTTWLPRRLAPAFRLAQSNCPSLFALRGSRQAAFSARRNFNRRARRPEFWGMLLGPSVVMAVRGVGYSGASSVTRKGRLQRPKAIPGGSGSWGAKLKPDCCEGNFRPQNQVRGGDARGRRV